MSRVKRGTIASKKRERLLRHTKGFRWDRKAKERAAREALLHAWSRSFRGRKEKKRTYRALWNVRINAAARTHSTTYSKLMSELTKKQVAIDRKMLADLAIHEPKTFEAVIALAKKEGT